MTALYIETTAYNLGGGVFSSFERTDILQISNINLYYKRSSARSNKTRERFRIQLLLNDESWSTRYNTANKDSHGNSITQWTLGNMKFL